MPRALKIGLKIALYFLLVITLLFSLLWYFLIGPKFNRPGFFYNKGKNAVWLAHSWIGKDHSEEEIKNLVSSLEQKKIKYVFVHSGPIESKGTISPERYLYAEHFLKIARKYQSEKDSLIYLAWLGQKKIFLSYEDPAIREKLSEQARFFTYQVGFDGIHFDIEPIADQDQGFLLLLEETKKKIGMPKILSIATDEWQPRSLSWFLSKLTNKPIKSFLSSGYFSALSESADQIVVMTYDSGLHFGRLYQWWVEQQVIYVTKAVQNKEVLIGIPVYSEQNEGTFYPEAENIQTGLQGVISGLNNWRSQKSSFAGVAIYPYWEIDESEWGIYDQLWN